MNYALERFTTEVREAIAATGQAEVGQIELTTPRPNIPADLAFPTFRLAKEQGLVAPQLATDLAAAIRVDDNSLIGKVEAVGPFLNFSMHPERLAVTVLNEIFATGTCYGTHRDGHAQRVVVDYSAPNIAKRMHVGHIRSTIIGQAIVNLYRALGYEVIGDNHLGDWGKQFGVVLASIEHEGKPEGVGEAALEALEAQYARFAAAAKDDSALDELARQWSLRLEQGDPQARELWQWSVDLTMEAAQRNYDRLGVKIDHAYGESFYEPMLAGVIQEALDCGVAYRDAGGAVVIENLQNLPTFLLQRSDSGTLYMTRDVATIVFRMREFNPQKIVYVIGEPQALHLRQLFALMRAMGYAQEVELTHVAFGTVFDAQGQPLSTRRGNMVYLEALLDDAVSRARAVVERKSPDLPEAEKDAVAEAVGVGAVVYNDLYQDPKRNITLDWERMLATEGNSATYLQYSYARCRSLLRRAREDGGEGPGGELSLLVHPSETRLIKHLARLPEAVREAGARYAPFVVADWCYTTAREFGVFFEQCPVLKAETALLRGARLSLVAATAQALHNGLSLLGIQAPERM
ncbi:arginine--tRNA ligase [Candidatus Chloroploca asiatica]|uniref:Arginine--tRNA ligase n=1 Tax=Candidatus Chloroploca asiatica TaxID=1506545 RepID=A0A2H3L609_9CHLR|nr:arginine--tRNA ligase [Candidatus Chloroploca asiatica]PDV98663.1 arginine--tRNA ligase [Candidatus Chloroploca asiatica]